MKRYIVGFGLFVLGVAAGAGGTWLVVGNASAFLMDWWTQTATFEMLQDANHLSMLRSGQEDEAVEAMEHAMANQFQNILAQPQPREEDEEILALRQVLAYMSLYPDRFEDSLQAAEAAGLFPITREELEEEMGWRCESHLRRLLRAELALSPRPEEEHP